MDMLSHTLHRINSQSDNKRFVFVIRPVTMFILARERPFVNHLVTNFSKNLF